MQNKCRMLSNLYQSPKEGRDIYLFKSRNQKESQGSRWTSCSCSGNILLTRSTAWSRRNLQCISRSLPKVTIYRNSGCSEKKTYGITHFLHNGKIVLQNETGYLHSWCYAAGIKIRTKSKHSSCSYRGNQEQTLIAPVVLSAISLAQGL